MVVQNITWQQVVLLVCCTFGVIFAHRYAAVEVGTFLTILSSVTLFVVGRKSDQ